MANPSFFAPSVVPTLGYPVTENLARNNHALWRAQVLSALRGAQAEKYINSATPVPPQKVPKAADQPDDIVPNPYYDAWVAKDQQVLNYLLSSMSREILSHVTMLTLLHPSGRRLKRCSPPNLEPG
jgi:hypothetical protein